MRTLSVNPTSAEASTTARNHEPPQQLQSPWHSPVPYLFGGLAAMLCLIAVALLILACSYLRSTVRAGDGGGGQEDEKESRSGAKAANASYEEKVLVIMAGEDVPTFLATPAAKKCVCGEAKIGIWEDDGGGETGDDGDGEKEKDQDEAGR